MIDTALTWIARGVPLVPIQPHSKHLIAGFGPHQQTITTELKALFWFRDRQCNLGLVCGRGLVVLDFDDTETYWAWCEDNPDLYQSYTERTPRGVHVFFYGDSASGEFNNIEVKGRGSVIMAAPSVHPSGVPYLIYRNTEILEADAFLPFSEKPVVHEGKRIYDDDVIGRIKAAFPIADFVMTAWPTTRLKPSGARGFLAGLCPFHDDNKASFWVHPDGVCGCHGCDVHGDVVNLYARRYGLTVQGAINEMASNL